MDRNYLMEAAKLRVVEADEAFACGHYKRAITGYEYAIKSYRVLVSQDSTQASMWEAKAVVCERKAEQAKVLLASGGATPVATLNKPQSKAPARQNQSSSPSAPPKADIAGGRVSEKSEDNGTANEFFTFIPADNLTVTFEDVIGLDEAKQAVTEYIINPMRYPEAYNYKFLGNKGILLEGPPGTGKSMFAKAVAKEINQPFALINMAQLVNCFVGKTGQNIDKVFSYLREYAQENNCGVTIFFDEFDEIAKRRGGDDKAAEAAVPALLRNLDGFLSDDRFLIIANTNCKTALDVAILDRFRQHINVPLPNTNSRYLLFLSKTADMESEYRDQIDWQRAAKLSAGLSGRSITFLCDDLKYFVSGVKAGIKEQGDLNEKIAKLIKKSLGSDVK